ncbi:MAG: hypothetical protein IEMM0008_0796 [bacterium]|nr:MAG: hypothetical protein IEMM0008_0796 [bacterium]
MNIEGMAHSYSYSSAVGVSTPEVASETNVEEEATSENANTQAPESSGDTGTLVDVTA